MQPSFWSRSGYKNLQLGWHQAGDNLVYETSRYNTEMQELNPLRGKHYMQLSFSYTF